ncbi:MAG: nitroreductase family protein [Clostridiales bacterium]|nr:nitroreductase family protein [Clostridiales bacterium]
MNNAGFEVDYNKCTGCGKCVKVCPGGVIFVNEMKKAEIKDFSEFGWNGCLRCEHCLAVCPTGAVSVLGHKPENSTAPVDCEKGSAVINSLIANRHSCRRYKDENVDKAVIDDMISRLANAPNGGNKQLVEFTLTDDKEQTEIFRSALYKETERLAAEGIYPKGFDKKSYEDMKRWEKTVRPDMLLCGAPHLLIPHAPLGQGEPVIDTVIAGTYFELLCASRGLGAVMLTFPLDSLENMPNIKAMLKIPENHYIGMIIGFGYPEIDYARGVQKTVDESRIHRLKF